MSNKRPCAFLICLQISGRQSKRWHGQLMNGSLCRVRDPSKAAKDHRGGGGRARQVAMAGEPLLQQPSHLRRLHHHQPMGRHGCSLCAQVRLSARKRLAWPLCRELFSWRRSTSLPIIFELAATGYLKSPAGWSTLASSHAVRPKWLSMQDTPWRRSSTM